MSGRLPGSLGVPLTAPDGYNVGSLCIVGTEARSFSDKDGEVLASFARLVVSQRELRLPARRDALTGALDRRAFEEAPAAATVRARHPLASRPACGRSTSTTSRG